MQLFEIFILIILFISSFTLFTKPVNRPVSLNSLPFLTLLPGLLHLIFEGFRWQMIPAYFIAVLFLVQSFLLVKNQRGSLPTHGRRWLRIAGALFSIMLLISSTVLAFILPVFNLPNPTGPYMVGTTTFMLEHSEREEVITEEPDDLRRLMVRAWYPADSLNSEAEQMEYMHPYEAQYFAKKYGLPAFTLDHLKHIETFAYLDLSVSEQESTFPVLLFSHGYNVAPATYASFVTEIASHGYIIFAVNHPYQSVATVFPDGEKVAFDYQYESKKFENVWEQIVELEEQFWAADTDSAKRDVIREISDLYPNAEMMRHWSDDLSFVIDELERMNINDENRFCSKMNLDKIGVFGHSAGGGTAGQLMISDSRVTAGINWDGAQWADMVDSTLHQPFLRIEAVYDSTKFAPNDLIYHNVNDSVHYAIKVKGIGHSNFSDIPLLIPIQPVNQAGDMDPNQAIELINEYSITFFDIYLRDDQEFEIMDLNQKYHEVQ